MGVADDFFGNAAHQHFTQTGAAMGRDQDQVRLFFARGRDDFLPWISAAHFWKDRHKWMTAAFGETDKLSSGLDQRSAFTLAQWKSFKVRRRPGFEDVQQAKT